MTALDPAALDELRAENARGYREDGWVSGCLFTDAEDPSIPAGYSCGGCACHLSAPCDHCLNHLDPDESHYLATALQVSGRWTRWTR